MPIVEYTDQQAKDIDDGICALKLTPGYRPRMPLPIPAQVVQKAGNSVPFQMPYYRFKSQGVSGVNKDDHIVCRSWDPVNKVEGTTDILIGKPWFLQRTPFDAVTYNGRLYVYTSATVRNVTFSYGGNSVALTERITPDYVLNDLIRAFPASTGLVDGSSTPVPIVLEELNSTPRGWGEGEA